MQRQQQIATAGTTGKHERCFRGDGHLPGLLSPLSAVSSHEVARTCTSLLVTDVPLTAVLTSLPHCLLETG